MKFTHVKSISEYNSLLESLNTLGRYQICIFVACTLFWGLAGIFKIVFELGFSSFKCPYALGTFQGLGILIFCYIANLKGRKVATIVASFFSILGFVFCLLCILDVNKHIFNDSYPTSLGTVGIATMGLSIYAQPCLILCIVCELTTPRAIQVVYALSLAVFSFGKIIAVHIYDALGDENQDFNIALFILAPSCLLSLLLGIFINDSPRYFIQTNIHKAEQLIKKIVKTNGGNEKQVMSHIDENFLLKHIQIRRYNYFTLAKFHSFGFAQYCTAISMLLLGMMSRQSNFVFQLKTTMVPPQIQIVWISGFQIIGIIATIFFFKFLKRKWTCMFTSLLIAIVSTILYFIYDKDMAYDLVILGLNAVFSIILYAFLVIYVIQFYPHSIRTLGLGMMLSSYYFGQLLFYIYLLTKPEPTVVLQFFLMGSWIMFGHCFGFQETLKKGLSYEIKEIEQQENQQF